VRVLYYNPYNHHYNQEEEKTMKHFTTIIGEFLSPIDRSVGRMTIRRYYEVQKIRAMLCNMARALIYRLNEGIPLNQKLPKSTWSKSDNVKKYEDKALPQLITGLQRKKILSSTNAKYIKNMMETAAERRMEEAEAIKIFKVFEQEPMHQLFLQHVHGISTVLSANLIATIGYADRFKHISNLWSYFGLDPESAKPRVKGVASKYSPQKRSLAYKVGSSLVMTKSLFKEEFFDPYFARQKALLEATVCSVCGNPCQYVHHVYSKDALEEHIEKQKKAKKENKKIPADKHLFTPLDKFSPKSNKHAYNRAIRYIAKMFLAHYFVIAKTIINETPDALLTIHYPELMRRKPLQITEPWACTNRGGSHAYVDPFDFLDKCKQFNKMNAAKRKAKAKGKAAATKKKKK
jgi:hypothetical protein